MAGPSIVRHYAGRRVRRQEFICIGATPYTINSHISTTRDSCSLTPEIDLAYSSVCVENLTASPVANIGRRDNWQSLLLPCSSLLAQHENAMGRLFFEEAKNRS